MNEAIGEREIEVGGEVLKCRPSFESLVEMESIAKATVVEFFDRFAAGTPKMIDVAAIIYCAHKDAVPDTKETVSSIGSKILKTGLMNTARPAFEMISFVLAGSDSEKKKAQAKQKRQKKK